MEDEQGNEERRRAARKILEQQQMYVASFASLVESITPTDALFPVSR